MAVGKYRYSNIHDMQKALDAMKSRSTPKKKIHHTLATGPIRLKLITDIELGNVLISSAVCMWRLLNHQVLPNTGENEIADGRPELLSMCAFQ